MIRIADPCARPSPSSGPSGPAWRLEAATPSRAAATGRRARRRIAVVAALAALLPLAGCRPEGSSAERCALALGHEFTDLADAERRTALACVRGVPRRGHDAEPVEKCIAGDPFGAVARARARLREAEARACPAGTPVLGAAGASAAQDAAAEASGALARGLFGRDLDGAIVSPRPGSGAARCQQRLLERAGDCSARFLEGYQRCAAAALAQGADDAYDLVACKAEDSRGAIARACDARIADAVGGDCAGFDPAQLFPGCAGDLAACARAHARRSASLAVNRAAGLCAGVRPGELDEETLLRCFEPPAEEPLVRSEVPLPAGVVASDSTWDADGEHLLFSFTAPDVAGTQVGRIREDGTGFRCLTCGAGISGNLRPAQLFSDGRRVLVAGPNNPNPRWFVLECTPSLLDCQRSVLLPIRLPPNPDPSTAILQYRVPHVTRDDAWFVWTEVRLRGPGGNLSAMGRLVRDSAAYVVQDARVIAPAVSALDLGTDSALWRGFTQPFEAKDSPMRGGLDWVVAGTPEAGHYDDFVVELDTGRVRRLTRHPDHDEGITFTRDEEWAIFSSARTDDRVEFLGLLPRPPYVDWIAFSTHFVAIAGAPSDGLSPGGDPAERDCYLDPWLLDRWFERGSYLGQRLLQPADGWQSTAGGFDFSPDGTKLVLTEQRWRRLLPPGTREPTRVTVARLPSRAPIPPSKWVRTVPTPEPTWAVRYEDWIVPDTSGVTVIPGKVSGTATIDNAMPSTLQGRVEVVYDRYSDDGESVLDGFERLAIPSTILAGADYEVDLTIAGRHTGTMKGAVHYDFANDVNTGEVVTRVDGRLLRGPRTCYEAGLIPVP